MAAETHIYQCRTSFRRLSAIISLIHVSYLNRCFHGCVPGFATVRSVRRRTAWPERRAAVRSAGLPQWIPRSSGKLPARVEGRATAVAARARAARAAEDSRTIETPDGQIQSGVSLPEQQ